MPTYDYVCKACDHAWEHFQSIKSNPIRKCPNCGKLQAKRVIGAGAGIIFKGSGFYQTDYRSKAYQERAEADQKAQDKSFTKSESTKKSAGGESNSSASSASSDTSSSDTSSSD